MKTETETSTDLVRPAYLKKGDIYREEYDCYFMNMETNEMIPGHGTTDWYIESVKRVPKAGREPGDGPLVIVKQRKMTHASVNGKRQRTLTPNRKVVTLRLAGNKLLNVVGRYEGKAS